MECAIGLIDRWFCRSGYDHQLTWTI